MRDDVAALFDHKHGLPRDAVAQLPPDAVDEVAAMVSGRVLAPDLSRAMEILLHARPQALRRALPDIALDSARPVSDRAVAVRFLSRAGGRAAHQHLRALTRDDEMLLRLTAASELGAVGTRAALPELERLVRSPDEPVRRMAILSAALVAFRHDVPGHEPELPRRFPPSRARWDTEMQIREADPAIAEKAARDVSSYGLQPAPSAAESVQCGRQRLVLLPARELTKRAAVRYPGTTRRLAAIVGEKAEVDETYATSLLILTWPSTDGGQQLGAFRTDGTPMYGGIWNEDETFELAGLSGAGAFTAQIEGNTRRGIAVEVARAGRTDRTKRLPVATAPPP
jgi:HEAT repeats